METAFQHVYEALASLSSLKVRVVRMGGLSEVSLAPGEIGIGISATGSGNESLFVPALAPSGDRTACLSRIAAEQPMPDIGIMAQPVVFLTSWLKGATLVIQDAGPDRVLALAILLARLVSKTLPPGLQAWIDAAAIARNEGNISGEPKQNWYALHSAGTHAIFSREGDESSAESYGTAWLYGLQFLTDALRRGLMPDALAPDIGLRHQTTFLAALEREQDIYRGWLNHADIIQLRLPLSTPSSQASKRFRLVDAILYEEDDAAGAAKLFMRNDLKNAPLGRGFDVAVSYRPKGPPGTRFTLTCDPRAGVSLEPIYHAIEAAECAAWEARGLQRPSDTPRALDGVKDNQWNEPWYDGRGTFTQIVEPRQEKEGGGVPGTPGNGSLLGWEDIKRLVWSTASPLKHIKILQFAPPGGSKIEAAIGKERTVWDLCENPGGQKHGNKRLINLRWAGENTDDSFAIEVPTVQSALASLPKDRRDRDRALSVLSDPKSFERVDVQGGFGIVTRDGAVLFDDWRPWPLPTNLLLALFVASARKDAALDNAKTKFDALQARFSVLMDQPVGRSTSKMATRITHRATIQRERENLMRETILLQLALKQIDREYETRIAKEGVAALADQSAARWREALDHRWGLTERSNRYAHLVTSMLDSVKTTLELAKSAFERTLFLLGFAITPAAVISEPMGETVAGLVPRDQSGLIAGSAYLTDHAQNHLQIVSALLLSVLLFVSLRRLSTSLERRAQGQNEPSPKSH